MAPAILIGTRSRGVHAVQDLGIIIIDEGHDGSFKQGRFRFTTRGISP